MVPLAPIFKKAYLSLVLAFSFYLLALVALTNPWLQRHVMYVHRVRTSGWFDVNKPEAYGFAKNQVTPFNFTTPDNETIYAWHILPPALYAKHENDLMQQPSGLAEDITQTKAFHLLKSDADSRLIINFHGTAGSVAQGWRTNSYRALSAGDPSKIHVLAIDYRGYGRSTGFPSEDGLIIDGVAAVDWAMKIAKIPSERIVILGQSLGTAVVTAVAEHYALQGIEFAGLVLVAGFKDMATLLTSYSIAGFVPILSPLRFYAPLQNFFSGYVLDRWQSATRLANYVRASKKVRLYLLHAKDDYEIPWYHSDSLFFAAANATTDQGMDVQLLGKMKARSTVEMGAGAFVSTWNAGDNKIIREEVVSHGGHNRIMTYVPISLMAWKAFGLEEEEARRDELLLPL